MSEPCFNKLNWLVGYDGIGFDGGSGGIFDSLFNLVETESSIVSSNYCLLQLATVCCKVCFVDVSGLVCFSSIGCESACGVTFSDSTSGSD